MAMPPKPAGRTGLSRGQMVAIGAVVVLVLGLFGFMVTNTGQDKRRERAIAAASADDEIDATAAPDPDATGSVPELDAIDGEAVADLPAEPEPGSAEMKYCVAGESVAKFIVDIADPIEEQDFHQLFSAVQSGREQWLKDLDAASAGSNAEQRQALASFKAAYEHFFDAITSSSDFPELAGKMNRDELKAAGASGQAFFLEVKRRCE